MKLLVFILAFLSVVGVAPLAAADFDIRAHGATGDGKTLDTAAINRAIEAAAAAGGGTVRFPAGTYASYSIRLKSNITLHLDAGATLLAADAPPVGTPGGYDDWEPNEWGDKHQYQDFGHSHWRNSLIWGEGLENITISGSGRIWGKGLQREENRRQGLGNKTIALKNCRNVTIRDISILQAGHFGILPTGVDNFTIDNVRIDTNRDGINIDCCRNVRIANCTINSPRDDAIVLKSSFALGVSRITENVTITNCQVTGYDVGTLLDGTYRREMQHVNVRGNVGPTGRIKLGTESTGGFRNIAISNCVFEYSRGLALESVDGGVMEDISISNLTMRDVPNAPIFIRLGNRARGPTGRPVSTARRISISNIVASNVSPEHGILILGIPSQSIEDVRLSNITLLYRGGGTAEQAAREVPEMDTEYPEPSRFGRIPAYGMFARHVNGLVVRDLEVRFAEPDLRPAIVLDHVSRVDFDRVEAQRNGSTPRFVLRQVKQFSIRNSPGVADSRRDAIEQDAF